MELSSVLYLIVQTAHKYLFCSVLTYTSLIPSCSSPHSALVFLISTSPLGFLGICQQEETSKVFCACVWLKGPNKENFSSLRKRW